MALQIFGCLLQRSEVERSDEMAMIWDDSVKNKRKKMMNKLVVVVPSPRLCAGNPALSRSFSTSLSWCTATGTFLKREAYGLINPLVFMRTVTPIMALSTGLLSLVMDPWYEFAKNIYFNSSRHVFRSFLLMLFGGTLAFFMVLVEFILISVTSAVTVTIVGVVKEALTITAAVFYFHDEFTWLKVVGLLIIMLGVSLFNLYKYLKLQKGHGAKDNPEHSVTTEANYVILDKMDDHDDSA